MVENLTDRNTNVITVTVTVKIGLNPTISTKVALLQGYSWGGQWLLFQITNSKDHFGEKVFSLWFWKYTNLKISNTVIQL